VMAVVDRLESLRVTLRDPAHQAVIV
jgi:hypothetical protein